MSVLASQLSTRRFLKNCLYTVLHLIPGDNDTFLKLLNCEKCNYIYGK